MDMNKTTHFHALIPASGTGQRLGGDTPKQYQTLHGKAILRHTLETFLSHPECRSCTLIINPDHQDLYNAATQGLNLRPPVHGGAERNISIYNALKGILDIKPQGKILIHDAVRPFIRHEHISAVAQALDTHQAVSLAEPISDTLRHDNGDIIDRAPLSALQTPQGFHFETIKTAHEKGKSLTVTDDTALVGAMGIPVHLIQGSKTNFKITTPEDMTIANALMNQNLNAQTRTGMGFDVHAFETGRPLILGGIQIPHDKGLAGHSDADVALHALTDALLGAIGEGDIGRHFPPSDDSFKNMDSSIFLTKTMAMLGRKNARITNIDLTIICEEPKITPHEPKMRRRIAEITKIDQARINIKATTTERLGFTGRGEGIAAQAIATIEMSPS